jgi:TonB family protein
MSAPGSAKQQPISPPKAAQVREVRLNWELPRWLPDFSENLSFLFRKSGPEPAAGFLPGIFWKDVFVDQRLNWRSILRSYAGHMVLAGLVYLVSMPFYQERLEVIENFQHDRLVYLNPEQDVLVSEPAKAEPLPPKLTPIVSRSSRASEATPADARKRVVEAMAIPKWADNSTHTILAPAAPKILASAPVPDIVLSSPVPQAPPVAAANSPKLLVPVLEVTPVAPPPDVTQAKANVPALPEAAAIAPPVDTSGARSLASINLAPAPQAVNAEPKLTIAASHALPNLGNVEPVAPAPDLKSVSPAQLASAIPSPAQPIAPPPDLKTVAGTAGTSGKLPEAEAVAPPPDISGEGSASEASGTLISLNLNPIAGPPRQPDGSRRGAFAGQPDGKPTAAGTPARQTGGNGPGGDSPVPTKDELGIVAAAVPRGVANGAPAITSQPLMAGGMDSLSRNSLLSMARPSHLTLPPPKVAVMTEPNAVDERVFRGRKYYTMALNKPNLTSVGGSWIFRFAERGAAAKAGEVTAPIPVREVDPAYPADMIHDNVQGVVILYAVIRADGTVAEVKVLEGFDDRLDENARQALSSWTFVPGTRDGNPVDLEAVVRIPFRTKRVF